MKVYDKCDDQQCINITNTSTLATEIAYDNYYYSDPNEPDTP